MDDRSQEQVLGFELADGAEEERKEEQLMERMARL
jgi:hypothetical protein